MKPYSVHTLLIRGLAVTGALVGFANSGFAQSSQTGNLINQPGIIGTIVLLLFVVLFVAFIAIIRLGRVVQQLNRPSADVQERNFDEAVVNLSSDQLSKIVERRQSLAYQLAGNELAGNLEPFDERGLISHLSTNVHAPLVPKKRRHSASVRLTRG